MEWCKCLPLNSKFAWKSVLVKTKPFNRQTVISINQSAVHWHEHMPSALAATDQWPCRWCSAWTQPKTATLSFCKVVWRHYLGEVAKILSYFVANLSKTQHIHFYQNRSSIVEVVIKNFGVFMPHSVLPNVLCLLKNDNLYQARLLRSSS